MPRSSVRRAAWGVVLFAVAVAACREVSVTTVPVARVSLSPDRAELIAGEVLQIAATAVDESGQPVAAAAFDWSATPADVAQVDADGRVVALAPGTATISARLGGATGTAALSIGARGLLSLSSGALTFDAVVGAAAPVFQTVNVASGNDGVVAGLAAEVSYEAGAEGWLSASFDSDRAPASLTVGVTPAGLPLGVHRASIEITSESAENSPSAIAVQLSVVEPLPSIVLSAARLAFDGSDTKAVTVTNGGPGSLTGLYALAEYPDGGPTGWLSVFLSDTEAPTTIAVGADDSELLAGDYSARVVVGSLDAAVPVSAIEVTLTGGGPPPVLEVNPATVGLAATPGGSAQATVSVSNGGSGEIADLSTTVGYGVGQAKGWLTGTLDASRTPATLVLSASASGLAPGSYQASVEVVGSAPNSPVLLPVNFVVGSGPAVPTAPGGLTATVQGASTIQLTWTDNSTTESGFSLRRRVAGSTWQTLGSVAPDVTRVSDTGVVAGASYEYQVQACAAAGCSAWSNVASATVPGGGGMPAAPTGFSAVATGPWSIALGWTDNSTNELGFDIRKRGASGHWQILRRTAPNVTSDIDRGVGPGMTYDYQLRACSAAGCSAWTSVVTVVTPVPFE